MRRALPWLLVCLFVTVASAQPKKKAPAGIKLTPEIEKFAKDMGAAFDQLDGYIAQAEQADKASKFDEASRMWMSVRVGAQAVESQAALAARVGSFGEPMQFPTKRGKLTAKAYVSSLRKIAANADMRSGKAAAARDLAELTKRKRSFPESIAKAVQSLEASAQRAAQVESKDPAAALRMTKSVVAIAGGLRQNVASAVANKRAEASTTYPFKPKALSSAEVVARLDALIKDQKARATKLQPKATPVATKTSTPTAKRPGGAAPAPPAEGEPVETPMAGATCNDESAPSCDFNDRPCCPDKQCLPAGWTCGDGCDGLTGQTPERYECLDPALAPRP